MTKQPSTTICPLCWRPVKSKRRLSYTIPGCKDKVCVVCSITPYDELIEKAKQTRFTLTIKELVIIL
jgi:hypothetical protein